MKTPVKLIAKILLRLFFITGIVVLLLEGCSTTPKTQAGRSLQAIGASVDQAMKAYAEARALGKVSDAMHAKVTDLHDNKYNPAFKQAVIMARGDLSQLPPQQLGDTVAELIALIDSIVKAK